MINYLLLLSIVLYSAISLAQPVIDEIITINDIPSDKILTNEEIVIVKESLKTKIFEELTPIKNDYVDSFNRGTVEFNPKEVVVTKFPGQQNEFTEKVLESQNYSYHKVVIPDGTTIKEVNFSQKNPHTVSVEGKNLTFIGCNLNNVEIDPSWTLIDSLAIHTTHEIIEEGGKTFDVQYIEKDGKMVENERVDITPPVFVPIP